MDVLDISDRLSIPHFRILVNRAVSPISRYFLSIPHFRIPERHPLPEEDVVVAFNSSF